MYLQLVHMAIDISMDIKTTWDSKMGPSDWTELIQRRKLVKAYVALAHTLNIMICFKICGPPTPDWLQQTDPRPAGVHRLTLLSQLF